MTSIILVGIIGMIISAIFGTIWYSNATPMGRWHMEYLGFDKLSDEEKARMIAEAKPKMWKSYLAQMLLSFMTSIFIGFTTAYTVMNGGSASAVYYYVVMIWLTFIVPLVGQGLIWGTTSGSLVWKRFFSDSFANLFMFLLTAYVATLFF